MKRLAMVFAVTGWTLWATACPPGECQTDADCEGEGKICSASNTCVEKPGPIPFQDGGALDQARRDRAVEDSGPEDSFGRDLRSRDRPASFDASNPSQVSAFDVCSGPRAVALDSNAARVYVACEPSDTIKVYHSVTGVEIANSELTSLPSPCRPRALLLLDARSQLWVACGDSVNTFIYNVDPASGTPHEAGIRYNSIGFNARFAAGSDRLAWVEATGTAFHLRQVAGTTSTWIADVTGLQYGNGVAVTTTGSAFFTNSNSAAITRSDRNGGLINPAFSAPTVNNQLVAFSASRDVLVVASHTGYSRLNAGNGAPIGGAQSFGAGASVQALVAQPDGQYALLSRYNATSSQDTIDKISMDPGQATPTVSSQTIAGCNAVDLAIAADGRVFIACYNLAEVQVRRFGP